MRHLIELSGESAELAAAEAMAVACGTVLERDGRALVLESGASADELVSKLALAWSVGEHLFSCEADELDARIGELELPGNTFRVRASRLGDIHSPEKGKELARRVGGLLSTRYSVDLKSPDTELRVLMAERMHAGILQGEIDRSALESRKPENRPYNHPISLHPKLARALVNLTGIPAGGTLLDPFCGTGGILIEAGLMGCNVVGGDMDARMVAGTVLNLEHFGIRGHDIRQLDISEWPGQRGRVDAIATDPPYGRSASTAREPIESLYSRAFAACREMLKEGGRLAIALPSEKHLAMAEGFETEAVCPVRVHRSLTRHFCVLRAI